MYDQIIYDKGARNTKGVWKISSTFGVWKTSQLPAKNLTQISLNDVHKMQIKMY